MFGGVGMDEGLTVLMDQDEVPEGSEIGLEIARGEAGFRVVQEAGEEEGFAGGEAGLGEGDAEGAGGGFAGDGGGGEGELGAGVAADAEADGQDPGSGSLGGSVDEESVFASLGEV